MWLLRSGPSKPTTKGKGIRIYSLTHPTPALPKTPKYYPLAANFLFFCFLFFFSSDYFKLFHRPKSTENPKSQPEVSIFSITIPYLNITKRSIHNLLAL
jgi:hypothetical protein